ncbi:hypothetical protein [Poritiphilus flavus]|uniref:Uncharacterized protein n=1 Tax=Poritiphilus flavus TaxID=2697053 RepID=A0A6L9EEP2_9FLAO|nr:hypothetical protein [Poritiphilus flavus]NAS12978.1 hypothetical protein [Poritiphilus flavus]
MLRLRHILSIVFGFTLLLAFSTSPAGSDIRSNTLVELNTEWVARRKRYSRNYSAYSYGKFIRTNFSLLQYSLYQFASLLNHHNILQACWLPPAQQREFQAKTRRAPSSFLNSHLPAYGTDPDDNL